MDSSAAAGAGAALPPPLPQTGWLLKQSGGKVGGKKGVLSGNVSALVSSSATHDFSDLLLRTPAHALLFLQALAKWDRRWFVLRAGSPLTYYKDPREAEKGGQPAGSLECSGCTMERGVGGHEAQFALRTAERVLTLRAPSATEMNAWLLAAVACGGQASFAKELPSSVTTSCTKPRSTAWEPPSVSKQMQRQRVKSCQTPSSDRSEWRIKGFPILAKVRQLA